jgi:acetoin utilization deacetylase AcuC-like enzyme
MLPFVVFDVNRPRRRVPERASSRVRAVDDARAKSLASAPRERAERGHDDVEAAKRRQVTLYPGHRDVTMTRVARRLRRASATLARAMTSMVHHSATRHAPGANGAVPVVHHASYSKPVMPRGHRFPMTVFQRVHDILREEGVIARGQTNCFVPGRAPSVDELCRAHDEDYVRDVRASALDAKREREIGLPWSDALVERTLMEVSGTMLTVDLAMKVGLCVNTAGGTHHAHRDRGSGFCIVNDLAVSALRAIDSGAVSRVMIIDLDVHQGDGTAAILANEPGVFTFSAHAKSNFPARKQQSTRDVELPRGMTDDAYMAVVAAAMRESLEDFRPELVIYDAGVDVTSNDTLGHLDLTVEGLYRRERMVMDTVLGAGIPLAGVVGGGYSPDIDELASRHAVLHRVAREMFVDHGL